MYWLTVFINTIVLLKPDRGEKIIQPKLIREINATAIL
jgi:hypothetical protein